MDCVRGFHGFPERAAWCTLSGPGCGFAAVLATGHHTLMADAEGGVRVARHLAPLADTCRSEAGDVVDTIVGLHVDVHLWPAVRAAASLIGIDLRGDFDDRDPLGPPDLARARSVGPPDRGVLAMVERYGRGVVRHHPSVEPERVAAGIAAAYPGRRILIVAPLKRQCRRVMAYLRRAKVEAAWLRSGQPCLCPLPHVVVATPVQAPRGRGLAAVDLYVAVDALAALGSNHALDPSPRVVGLDHDFEVVTTPRPPDQSYDPTSPTRPSLLRRVGLIATDTYVTNSQQGRLRRAFGFSDAVVFPGGHEPPRVEVRWIPLRRPSPSPTSGGVSDLLHGVWTNPVRNRRLARAAIVEAECGSRVLIVAGSVAQAAGFARLLPDWPIRVTEGADLKGLSRADRRALRAASPAARGPRLIATAAAARPAKSRLSLRAVDFDVVVRAGGGTGLLPLLAEPPGVPSATGANVVLMDVADRGPATLRRAARRRASDYAGAGWYAAGADPVRERATAFVRTCASRVLEIRKEEACPTI